MRKYIIIFLFFFLSADFYAQAQLVTSAEQSTDTVARKVIRYMNANLPDSVYQLTGETFKQQINPLLWTNIYRNQLAPLLPFADMALISRKDGVNKYKLSAKMLLAFYIGLDAQGKINNLLFQPYQDDIKPATMTTSEELTDDLAQKVLQLINSKEADAVYQYAADSFKSKIDANTWRNIAQTGLFPLTPLPAPVFISSKNGVNKYKMNQYQFLFGLDQNGKFNTLAL